MIKSFLGKKKKKKKKREQVQARHAIEDPKEVVMLSFAAVDDVVFQIEQFHY